VEHHAEVLSGGVWRQRIPSWRDVVATLLVLGMVVLLGIGAHQMRGTVGCRSPGRDLVLTGGAAVLYTPYSPADGAALILSLIFTSLTRPCAHRSARSRRGEPQLSVLRLAAFLAPRSTVRHAWSRLEYDDVDVRRMVWFFCRRLRGIRSLTRNPKVAVDGDESSTSFTWRALLDPRQRRSALYGLWGLSC